MEYKSKYAIGDTVYGVDGLVINIIVIDKISFNGWGDNQVEVIYHCSSVSATEKNVKNKDEIVEYLTS